MEGFKKERAIAKGSFTRKLKVFNNSILNEEPNTVLEAILDEVNTAFKNTDEANNKLINSAQNDSEIEAFNQYMLPMEQERVTAYSTVCKLKESQTQAKHAEEGKTFCVKKLDNPMFDGDIRLFATFKNDYNRLMTPRYGRDSFVLKSCLTKEVLLHFNWIDDYDLMWERLEEKFGSAPKIIDYVVNSIKTLKPVPENNNSKMLELINTLERGWYDLKKLKKENEIENITVITYIEKLLPSNTMHDWAITRHKLSATDPIFPELMKFLTNERKVIEYLEENVRKSGSTSKISSNNLVKNDSEINQSDYVNLIQQMQTSQENQNKQFTQCLNNLTIAFNNLTNSSSKPVEKSLTGATGKWCYVHNTSNHDFIFCNTFKYFDNVMKLDVIKRNGLCFSCLTPGHMSNVCTLRKPCTVIGPTGNCNKSHHPILHDIFKVNISNTSQLNAQNNNDLSGRFGNTISSNDVLLSIGTVYCKDYPICTLYDTGADLSLITHTLAQHLGLTGTDIELSITKVGNVSDVCQSKCYKLNLVDLYGCEWIINACGINEITSDLKEINMQGIAEKLKVNIQDIIRPSKKVELLIGNDYCSLMPNVIKTVDNLQLLKNTFGVCVRGKCNSGVGDITCDITVRVSHIICKSSDDIITKSNRTFSKQVEDFFTAENLGTECNPRCGNCRCGKCSFDGQISIKEQREMNIILDNLVYDINRKHWIITYPWIKDPNDLPNNYSSAFARLKSTEKRLLLLGSDYYVNYDKQIIDMINRNVAEKLDQFIIDTYNGPVHYLPHHEIHKPSSTSTPLRIVFNSSSSFAGHILNDYYAKGPDVLNNMLGVLLRFRLGHIGVTGDIKKMYNAIHTSIIDQHTHRFLWRNMNPNRPPDHYILKRVTFGDRPSGAIAILALRKTAEMFSDKFPKAAEIVGNDSFVDDIIFSVDEYEEAESILSEIETILKEGGFEIKEWLISKDNNESDSLINISQDNDKVLGILWNPKSDQLKFQLNLNFSKKHRNMKLDSNIKETEMEFRFPEILTRRLVMRQTASLYDPLGLLTPITLQAKLLMRQLILEQRSLTNISDKDIWDVPLSNSLYSKWKLYFNNLFQICDISFNRCIKPMLAVNKPILILFSDGSSVAFGSCAYIRWELYNGSFISKLILSKNRIAPTCQLTIPRLELSGCILSCRLRKLIENELKIEFERIFHLTDSSIAHAQILNESSRFSTFVANKVAEIQRKSSKEEWFWISTNDNVADFTTRPLKPMEINSTSIWQCGPKFLMLPISSWPIKKIIESSVKLPDIVNKIQLENSVNHIVSKGVDTIDSIEGSVINASNYNDVYKLLRVTARILKSFKCKSLKSILTNPTVNELKLSEIFWIKEVQRNLGNDWKERYKRLDPIRNDDGIIVVGCNRLANWLKDNWNQSEFILLVPNHPFTKLYILSLHNIDHAGIETTIAKLQSKFWVPHARKLIKFIKSKCVQCRKLDKKFEEQCMGPLSENRFKQSPPFFRTSLDLFGPFFVKDTVKRRTTKKVYGLIFNCMVTRAIHLELVEGYDTQSFLISFKRFTAIRGYPGYIHSDNGSQLVAANKELREMASKWNLSDLIDFGTKHRMIWSFNKSANAPFQNGCSESLIRLVKRGIVISIGESVLSFSEMLTTFYEIANLLNQRPIGIKPGNDISLGTYLCPNDLILGRNNNLAPLESFDESDNIPKRYQFINKVISSFWKKWNRDYFPTLIVRQKWHVDRRDVRIGDIVLLQDKNSLKNSWKLAEVIKTLTSNDNRVRNVTVRYKMNKPGYDYKGQSDITVNRSVHSLIIILPIEEQ